MRFIRFCAVTVMISCFYSTAFVWAYIPDVGPGVCVSDPEACADYEPPSYSSGGSYSTSRSSTPSTSAYGSGGYYNSYDAMAMNTAMGLMGSFMSAVSAGMEQAAAQRAEYERQIAEQQRIEAELARQEQERLRQEKIANQKILRADYQAKMARSSSAIRAGIARIETMLGLNSSSDASPLKLETLEDINPGSVDWDGRQGGGAGSNQPLELMRDDFGDANVVDLRDKTDLTVRPELVSAMPGQAQAVGQGQPEQAAAGGSDQQAQASGQGQPGYEAPVSAEPSATETAQPPAEAVPVEPAPAVEETPPAVEPPQAETPAPQEPMAEPAPAEQPAVEEVPAPAPEQEPLTEHPPAFRQVELPGGSPSLVDAPQETAGAEVYSPSIPWRAVPVENSTVDPAVLKGATPPIRPETVESLKEERAMGENFNQKSAERVEEMQAESQMQKIRKMAEKDLQEKAVEWRKRQALEKEMAAREEEDFKKYPGLREAIAESQQEWAAAEKEYNERKAQQPKAPQDELSLLLFLEAQQKQPWPGPRNPEPPLTNPVESDEDHFAGVLKIWRQRQEAKSAKNN